MLSVIFMTATIVAVYWFWIRPILKSRPAFAEFYTHEESVFAAAREKLATRKMRPVVKGHFETFPGVQRDGTPAWSVPCGRCILRLRNC
jgi:hypothetical protein